MVLLGDKLSFKKINFKKLSVRFVKNIMKKTFSSSRGEKIDF